MESLSEWLLTLVQGLVINKENVKISHVVDEMGVLYSIEVHKEDIGKVIGKEGSIANAIRVLLRSAGRLFDIKASMKVDANTKFELPTEKR